MFRSYFLNPAYRWWSWGGACLTLFVTITFIFIEFQLNKIYGAFFDALQIALVTPANGSTTELYRLLFYWVFFSVGNAVLYPIQIYFRYLWSFQWRQAMTNYYMEHWEKISHIEGASQRVQENTDRLSSTLETLVVRLVRSILSLVVFLPLLWQLTSQVTKIPFVGNVSSLVAHAAIIVAVISSGFLMLIGLKLPMLQFSNQLNEAAFRKSLVIEEGRQQVKDNGASGLFWALRKGYLKYYFHTLYFEACKGSFLQIGVIVPYFILIPNLLAGAITFGVFQQITYVYTRVTTALQVPINSSKEIIEVIAIFKRLRPLDHAIEQHGK